MKRYLKEGYEVEWYCEGKLKKRIKIGGTGDPERDELMQELVEAAHEVEEQRDNAKDIASDLNSVYRKLEKLTQSRIIMRFEDDLTDCGDYLEKAESGLDNLYNKIMRHLSDLTADQFKLACRLHGIEGIIKKGTVKEVNSGNAIESSGGSHQGICKQTVKQAKYNK